MNMSERLAKARAQADDKEQTRRDFNRYLTTIKESKFWSEAEVKQYVADVKTLMTGSDEEVMDLFPSGFYSTAEEARQGAKIFWRNACL